MRAFLGTFYSLDPADRIFTMTKYSISHRLETGAAEAGVKRIRVHDLRHSHVSLSGRLKRKNNGRGETLPSLPIAYAAF